MDSVCGTTVLQVVLCCVNVVLFLKNSKPKISPTKNIDRQAIKRIDINQATTVGVVVSLKEFDDVNGNLVIESLAMIYSRLPKGSKVFLFVLPSSDTSGTSIEVMRLIETKIAELGLENHFPDRVMWAFCDDLAGIEKACRGMEKYGILVQNGGTEIVTKLGAMLLQKLMHILGIRKDTTEYYFRFGSSLKSPFNICSIEWKQGEAICKKGRNAIIDRNCSIAEALTDSDKEAVVTRQVALFKNTAIEGRKTITEKYNNTILYGKNADGLTSKNLASESNVYVVSGNLACESSVTDVTDVEKVSTSASSTTTTCDTFDRSSSAEWEEKKMETDHKTKDRKASDGTTYSVPDSDTTRENNDTSREPNTSEGHTNPPHSESHDTTSTTEFHDTTNTNISALVDTYVPETGAPGNSNHCSRNTNLSGHSSGGDISFGGDITTRGIITPIKTPTDTCRADRDSLCDISSIHEVSSIHEGSSLKLPIERRRSGANLDKSERKSRRRENRRANLDRSNLDRITPGKVQNLGGKNLVQRFDAAESLKTPPRRRGRRDGEILKTPPKTGKAFQKPTISALSALSNNTFSGNVTSGTFPNPFWSNSDPSFTSLDLSLSPLPTENETLQLLDQNQSGISNGNGSNGNHCGISNGSGHSNGMNGNCNTNGMNGNMNVNQNQKGIHINQNQKGINGNGIPNCIDLARGEFFGFDDQPKNNYGNGNGCGQPYSMSNAYKDNQGYNNSSCNNFNDQGQNYNNSQSFNNNQENKDNCYNNGPPGWYNSCQGYFEDNQGPYNSMNQGARESYSRDLDSYNGDYKGDFQSGLSYTGVNPRFSKNDGFANDANNSVRFSKKRKVRGKQNGIQNVPHIQSLTRNIVPQSVGQKGGQTFGVSAAQPLNELNCGNLNYLNTLNSLANALSNTSSSYNVVNASNINALSNNAGINASNENTVNPNGLNNNTVNALSSLIGISNANGNGMNNNGMGNGMGSNGINGMKGSMNPGMANIMNASNNSNVMGMNGMNRNAMGAVGMVNNGMGNGMNNNGMMNGINNIDMRNGMGSSGTNDILSLWDSIGSNAGSNLGPSLAGLSTGLCNGHVNKMGPILPMPDIMSTKAMDGGNSTMPIVGCNSTMPMGGGNSTILMGGGNSGIQMGGGNSAMSMGGDNSTIPMGGGNSTMPMGGGNAALNTGTGNLTLPMCGGNTQNASTQVQDMLNSLTSSICQEDDMLLNKLLTPASLM